MPLRSPSALRDRLAERDAGILGGVMESMWRSPLAFTLDVDQRMARQLLQHVVEEADAGLRSRRRPCRRGRSTRRSSVSVVLRSMVALRMDGSALWRAVS